MNLIEQRDRLGVVRAIEANVTVPLTEIVDAKGYTSLHMAAFKNFPEIIDSLLEKGKELLN